MTNSRETQSPTVKALRQYALLAVFYMILILVLPPNKATMQAYNLSSWEYHIVSFVLALPSLIVWLIAFVGYAKLKEYAHAISKTPEGIYFDELAGGCKWLAWSLPIAAIIPAILNSITNNQSGFQAGATIISNYSILILPLIGFSFIAAASRGLLNNIKVRLSLANTRVIIALFLILGVLYCFLTFSHFNLSSLGSSDNPYYLPAWLLVITLIVPYLYAWFMGILSVYEITLYGKHVQGVLYRQAFNMLAGGLLAVILSSVALQYISSAGPRAGHLTIDSGLIWISLFRIIGGGGFILLALGANKLKKIEEV